MKHTTPEDVYTALLFLADTLSLDISLVSGKSAKSLGYPLKNFYFSSRAEKSSLKLFLRSIREKRLLRWDCRKFYIVGLPLVNCRDNIVEIKLQYLDTRPKHADIRDI